jgi:acyl-CoA synthetase (AMP-forming)/AMP-acid ligase II
MDLHAIMQELKRSSDTFGPLIRGQAETIPDRIALKFEDETVTYGAYNEAVNRLAAVFVRAGVAAGTPVAILCLNSPLFLAAVGGGAARGPPRG